MIQGEKSIAIKSSWKFELNNAREYLYFIIYFIVQYHTHMTMKTQTETDTMRVNLHSSSKNSA